MIPSPLYDGSLFCAMRFRAEQHLRRQSDFRDAREKGDIAKSRDLTQTVLVVAGERDTLTPLPASHYLAEHLPDARLVTIKGAAHAPFLSHPDEFMKHLTSFLHE